MAKSEKRAKIAAEPQPEKKARFADPTFDDGHPLAWRFSHSDREGPFAWNITDGTKYKEVLEKLYDFESKNWEEIKAGGSHPIALRKLCEDARKRLVEIQLDDLDELLSLRLSGPNRVWCIRNGHIVRVLWWDANHQVYPVLKDKADRRKLRNRK